MVVLTACGTLALRCWQAGQAVRRELAGVRARSPLCPSCPQAQASSGTSRACEAGVVGLMRPAQGCACLAPPTGARALCLPGNAKHELPSSSLRAPSAVPRRNFCPCLHATVALPCCLQQSLPGAGPIQLCHRPAPRRHRRLAARAPPGRRRNLGANHALHPSACCSQPCCRQDDAHPPSPR